MPGSLTPSPKGEGVCLDDSTCGELVFSASMLCMGRKACRWYGVSASTCSCIHAREACVSNGASGASVVDSSETLRDPIGIICVAPSRLPFPGTFRSVYISPVEEPKACVSYLFIPIFEWQMRYHILSRIEDDIVKSIVEEPAEFVRLVH